MKVRHYRLGIFCPKYNNSTLTERDIHLLLIERIVPGTIAFCQAVKKPLGIKGRYISRATSRDNYRGCSLNLLSNIVRDYNFIYWHNVSLILHRLYLQLQHLPNYLLVNKNNFRSFYFLRDNISLCEILYLHN